MVSALCGAVGFPTAERNAHLAESAQRGYPGLLFSGAAGTIPLAIPPS